MSPALAGGFLTTAPPGKPSSPFPFPHILRNTRVQQKMGTRGDTGAETGVPHDYGLEVPAFPAPLQVGGAVSFVLALSGRRFVTPLPMHRRAGAAAHKLPSLAKVTPGPRLRWWNISSKQPECLRWRTAALGGRGHVEGFEGARNKCY